MGTNDDMLIYRPALLPWWLQPNTPVVLSPDSVANLAMWIRPLIANVTIVNTNHVSAAADLSSSGNGVTNGTDASRPFWVADAGNGQPGFGNNGTAACHLTNTMVLNQPDTIICVYRFPAVQTRVNIIFDGVTGRQAWQSNTSTNSRDFAGTTLTNTVADMSGRTIVHTSVFNGASSLFRINGVQYVSGNPGANNLTGGISIGDFGASLAIEGYIQEFLAYTRVLDTNSEIVPLENMLMARYP